MAVVEVLIGLVLVYLTLSLVCSTINEAFAACFNSRGTMLREAIASLLQERADTREGLLPALMSTLKSLRPALEKWLLGRRSAPPAATKRPSTDSFYDHPLIGSLRRSDDSEPSYIPNDVFVDVLIDRIAPVQGASPSERWVRLYQAISGGAGHENGAPPHGAERESIDLAKATALRSNLRTLLAKAQTRVVRGSVDPALAQLEAFKAELSNWFENTMTRTSSWYRHKTQNWVFVIALFVVTVSNADTLMVVGQLSRNPALREAVANSAQAYVEKSSADRSDPKELLQYVGGTELRFGWPDPELDSTAVSDARRSRGWWWLRKLVGLAVTIVAVSLGAPFWFQVLEKLVKLRSTVSGADSGAAPTEKGEGAGTTTAAKTPSPDARGAAASGSTASPVLPPTYWRDGVTRWASSATLPSDAPARSLLAAQLSALAYRHPGNAAPILASMGLESITAVDRHGTQAFSASHAPSRTLVIAFRGTEPAQIEDLVADAYAVFERGPFGSDDRVHGGFARALQYVLDELHGAVAPSLAKHERVLVTGHSLGAALATLYACHLARDPAAANVPLELVTFGSPRVGDGKFGEHFEALRARAATPGKLAAMRFVNNQDVVTRVAPRSMHYRHVGDPYWFDADGILRAGEEGWSRFLALVVDAVAEFRRAAQAGIEDHAIDRYVARLENWSERDA